MQIEQVSTEALQKIINEKIELINMLQRADDWAAQFNTVKGHEAGSFWICKAIRMTINKALRG